MALAQGPHQQLLEIPRRVRVDVLVNGLVRNTLAGVFLVLHTQPPGYLLW